MKVNLPFYNDTPQNNMLNNVMNKKFHGINIKHLVLANKNN